MTLGLLKTVLKRGTRVTKLAGYGNGVTIERLRYQIDREALTIEYAIVPEDDATMSDDVQGMNDVYMLRENRRLTRSIEFVLPSSEGWDVRLTTKASSEEVEKLPWTTRAIRSSSASSSQSPSIPPDQIVLRVTHAPLIDDHSVLKVRVVIEISGPSSGLRLNGLPQTIQDVEDHIVVDPPPQTITCLRRHRLSFEGGGLWITMTHDAMFVDDDRLLAIVRRAPCKEKGLVMINGTKVPVDVEELPESEIKLLTKQKRVKPPRIPLDQPPVMSVIRRRRAEWDEDFQGDGNGGTSLNTTGNGLSTWASAPRLSSPLARFFTYAVDQATTTTQQAMAAISPAVATGNAAVQSPSKAPMQYALDALAWTQETHANFPGTGWQLVSEKGLPIHKKLAPEICSVIPVHKGFKVIEGVSAEELAAVITEPDCQRKWDDRYDTSFVFESFGGKSRTSFVVSKAGFPWRDRGFYVASVMARAASTACVSRRNTSQGEVAEQSNGIRNAVFCVSASFSPDSVARFTSAKYNSYSLPIGRVYIDAWILETLDPYTKENYAIPSTRCTRLVAVDYAGSIPAAVNTIINATLPRSILALEAYIKGLTPHPVTRLPAPGLVITDKKSEGHLASTAWKLRKRDEERVLVGTRYWEEERVYVATILVPPRASAACSPNLDQASGDGAENASAVEQQTPRPSGMQLGGGAAEPSAGSSADAMLKSDVGVDAPVKTRSAPPRSPSSSPPGHPPPPPSSSPTIPSSLSSYVRGRTTSSAFTNKGEVRTPVDLVVGEVVVDSRLYADGYEVVLRSRMGGGAYVPLGDGHSSASAGERESVLPLAYAVHTMPSSPLHSSGLSEGESPTRHLIRLTLPTAQYQVSAVRDPLTGEMRGASPRPPWLVDMRRCGAVVEVEVRPGGVGGGTGSGRGKGREKGAVVMVDGKEVAVIGEKESLTFLGRDELLDDRVSKMGVLSRYVLGVCCLLGGILLLIVWTP
ncbi:hypothetical protein C0993_011592 [Termitomyces sp. T159_Od127]|nr:hypothetical protein C0993_011592 [Termitomyces sp. T159_Od127]